VNQPDPPASAEDAVMPLTSDATPDAPAQSGRLWVIAALLIIYAAMSHYSASTPDAKWLGAALSVGPVLAIGVILLWRWIGPWTAGLACAVILSSLYRYWQAIEDNYEWADLVEQCGIYGLIAISFARSLYGDRIPLCTQLATRIHGELVTAEVAYLWRATAAWAAFYGTLTAVILTLFFSTSQRVWSFFVNFVTFGLIVLFGIVDHVIRRRVLPGREDGGILGVLRRAIIG